MPSPSWSKPATQLLADPRCNGQVFVVGFCLGGAVALAAACFVPARRVDWAKRTVPVLGRARTTTFMKPVT